MTDLSPKVNAPKLQPRKTVPVERIEKVKFIVERNRDGYVLQDYMGIRHKSAPYAPTVYSKRLWIV